MPPHRGSRIRRQSSHISISSEDWEQQRERFTQLYLEDKFTLDKCMEVMENRYGFISTRRGYLRKIREWEIDKNIKPVEMKMAVRIVLERWVNEGKDTCIEIRGVKIDRDKLKRFLRREAAKAPASSSPQFETEMATSGPFHGFINGSPLLELGSVASTTSDVEDMADQGQERKNFSPSKYRVFTPNSSQRGAFTVQLYRRTLLPAVQQCLTLSIRNGKFQTSQAGWKSFILRGEKYGITDLGPIADSHGDLVLCTLPEPHGDATKNSAWRLAEFLMNHFCKLFIEDAMDPDCAEKCFDAFETAARNFVECMKRTNIGHVGIVSNCHPPLPTQQELNAFIECGCCGSYFKTPASEVSENQRVCNEYAIPISPIYPENVPYTYSDIVGRVFDKIQAIILLPCSLQDPKPCAAQSQPALPDISREYSSEGKVPDYLQVLALHNGTAYGGTAMPTTSTFSAYESNPAPQMPLTCSSDLEALPEFNADDFLSWINENELEDEASAYTDSIMSIFDHQ
ncbi:hypothetical protein ABW19_dt0210179 [Dactylella cylindrospora]|nr:hypothetical protein ABW19_dt0210179 [Dactylella cylindrospora]